jgi:tRNA U34 5-carboxymethylaminomethyl modifying enzyme MnmG/GidA
MKREDKQHLSEQALIKKLPPVDDNSEGAIFKEAKLEKQNDLKRLMQYYENKFQANQDLLNHLGFQLDEVAGMTSDTRDEN